MPKATHILSAASTGHEDHDPLRTPIAVYGEKDLNARLAAAEELGVEVTVTPISEAGKG